MGVAFAHDNEAVKANGAASWPLAIRETAPYDRDVYNTSGYSLPDFSKHAVGRAFQTVSAVARFRLVFHQARGGCRVVGTLAV